MRTPTGGPMTRSVPSTSDPVTGVTLSLSDPRYRVSSLQRDGEAAMFATNLVLILAFVGMIVGAIWLFRDGEGVGPKPVIKSRRAKGAGQIRIVKGEDAGDEDRPKD